MSEFKVDEHHPIPAMALPRGRKEKYPWSQMEVGESFFVEGGEINRLKSAASKAKGRTGRSYLARKVEGGVRIWRYE